jgi:hypothetical protein
VIANSSLLDRLFQCHVHVVLLVTMTDRSLGVDADSGRSTAVRVALCDVIGVQQLSDHMAAADVARLISPDLHVTGVVVSASGSEYAEVLVTFEGRWNETRRGTIGVRRRPPLSALREQLAARLTAVYCAYRDS